MNLFSRFLNLTLIFCLRWGSKMSTHNQNGILQRYLIVCKHVGAETFFSSIEIWVYFWFCQKLQSPWFCRVLLSNKQSTYVTVYYCLNCIEQCLISRLATLFSLYLMRNGIVFVVVFSKRNAEFIINKQITKFRKIFRLYFASII